MHRALLVHFARQYTSPTSARHTHKDMRPPQPAAAAPGIMPTQVIETVERLPASGSLPPSRGRSNPDRQRDGHPHHPPPVLRMVPACEASGIGQMTTRTCTHVPRPRGVAASPFDYVVPHTHDTSRRHSLPLTHHIAHAPPGRATPDRRTAVRGEVPSATRPQTRRACV